MTKKGGIAYEMCEKEITMSINGNGILVLSLYQNCRRWKMTQGWQNRKKQKNYQKIKKGSVF